MKSSKNKDKDTKLFIDKLLKHNYLRHYGEMYEQTIEIKDGSLSIMNQCNETSEIETVSFDIADYIKDLE